MTLPTPPGGGGDTARPVATDSWSGASVGASVGAYGAGAYGIGPYGVGEPFLPLAPRYRWVVGPWRTGPELELAGTSRSLKLSLLEPDEATVSLRGRLADTPFIETGAADLWVYRDADCIFRGRVVQDDVDFTAESYSVGFTARSYETMLDQAILHEDKTWASIAQEDLVWELIEYAQHAYPGGDLGLVQGVWPTATNVTRTDVEFKAGDTIYQCIKKLAEMPNGFDWQVTPALTVDLYFPRLSVVNRGAVLDFGGLVSRAKRSTTSADYANSIRQSGADGTDAVLVSENSRSLPAGRWEKAVSDTALSTQAMVQAAANAELNRLSAPSPSYSLELTRGAWRGLSHIAPRDEVKYVVKAGDFSVAQSAVVSEISITVDSGNQESVSIVVNKSALSGLSHFRELWRLVQYQRKT
jgi:hypothetical protein